MEGGKEIFLILEAFEWPPKMGASTFSMLEVVGMGVGASSYYRAKHRREMPNVLFSFVSK